jgi:hypothetical protein
MGQLALHDAFGALRQHAIVVGNPIVREEIRQPDQAQRPNQQQSGERTSREGFWAGAGRGLGRARRDLRGFDFRGARFDANRLDGLFGDGVHGSPATADRRSERRPLAIDRIPAAKSV